MVLERGIGSCGEYVGVLLALARLNGIACRTVGRYKCPPKANQRDIPLEPDYNHVWIEFYVPGYGWLPMESNPDDIIDLNSIQPASSWGYPGITLKLAREFRSKRLKQRMTQWMFPLEK